MMIMKEGWHDARAVSPRDSLNYVITNEVIQFTETVLHDYGEKYKAEGLVYWAGIKTSDKIIVNTCIAPKLVTSRYGLTVSHISNYYVVEALSESQVIHLGQVHSHPFKWVGHSHTDNEQAAFKVEGLLSVVVPHFCQYGMLPLISCGVHRFSRNHFIRLSDQYVKERLQVSNSEQSILIDQRNHES
jgi:hypothetical protein